MNPGLTDEEIKACYGERPDHVPQQMWDQMNELVLSQDRVIADAAERKALWWACRHVTFDRPNFEAMLLEMGIAPWEAP